MTKNTDLAYYLDKPVSVTSQSLADWLTEHTGYAVDVQTVALVQSLHGKWQSGPANRARLTKANTDREAAAVTKAKARAERAATAVAKPAKPEKVAKAKPAAKKPVAKVAPRRRPAKSTPTNASE